MRFGPPLKGEGTAGEIRGPELIGRRAHHRLCFCAASTEPLAPDLRRALVVAPPALHIMDFKFGGLHLRDRVADIVKFAARKDVFLQGPLLGPFLKAGPLTFSAAADRVVQE